ncbi:MAG: hypothetical protein HOP13_02925 [Alphaproteobacteria bacterium]|nr:hypothetical protein [Alphaproteobacteria bacterium]
MLAIRARTIATFVLSLYVAFVFVQSLFFKWTGSEESVFIFATLRDWSGIGLFEPFGRFFIGLCELAASILLFVPRARIWGAGMALAIITGAIFFHLFTPLGVEIKGDGGLLFALACGVWLASAAILLIQRREAMALLLTIRGLLRHDGTTAH